MPERPPITVPVERAAWGTTVCPRYCIGVTVLHPADSHTASERTDMATMRTTFTSKDITRARGVGCDLSLRRVSVGQCCVTLAPRVLPPNTLLCTPIQCDP